MKKFLILMSIFLITGCGCNKEKVNNSIDDTNPDTNNIVEEKKISIIDLESNTRPIAVMVNNHPAAVPNHAGLQDAYLTYEIIVEGGLTRLMALYKDKTTAKIGSVRSSRHYYLDYVLENDAIYTHFGYSTIAEKDIPILGINNVNGLVDAGFWRDTSLNVAYEHTAFTNIENVLSVAQSKGYRTTTEVKPLLNYSGTEVDLSKNEDSISANEVSITYSYSQSTGYIYDSENKVYKRYINGNPHTDAITKEQYTVKNIIVAKIENVSIDGYLQDLKNIGTGDGYYITNGYAVPIKWKKDSRESQTAYTYLSGEEIDVNDGNTFIQIQPINEELIIK